MTYNVFSETLNPTQSINLIISSFILRTIIMFKCCLLEERGALYYCNLSQFIVVHCKLLIIFSVCE